MQSPSPVELTDSEEDIQANSHGEGEGSRENKVKELKNTNAVSCVGEGVEERRPGDSNQSEERLSGTSADEETDTDFRPNKSDCDTASKDSDDSLENESAEEEGQSLATSDYQCKRTSSPHTRERRSKSARTSKPEGGLESEIGNVSTTCCKDCIVYLGSYVDNNLEY